ncbi:MAG TPA: peptidyl-tRNA hydrolase Pth2 [Candidatus Norongarragalinales archaeon]|nr:peptidyl-tRNA hydrolase Pth2 [Candidatus Norongarragalinales archaeon]
MAFKQALIVRTDLGMGKGKIAAQCAHGSIAAYLKADERDAQAWADSGMEKVVLKVAGEKELVLIFEKAKKAGLPAALIRDAGHTQVPSGSKTVVGIGPASENALDRITGELKLL